MTNKKKARKGARHSTVEGAEQRVLERPPNNASLASGTQSFRRLRYLYGAVTQAELNNFLETNAVDGEDTKAGIRADWREAAELFQSLVQAEAGVADTVESRPLAASAESFVQRLRQTPTFIKTFADYPLSIEEVEIDRLVAPQRYVHLDYVDKLKSRFVPARLPEFCFDPSSDATPVLIARTDKNVFTASSENPGLRLLGAIEQPYNPSTMPTTGGQPVHAIFLLCGYGSCVINVLRVGRRLILNNGFHRLYALRSLGVSRAPVVVQHVTRPESELPPVVVGLSRDYLVGSPRPAIMRDFFDERLNCQIRQRNFVKSLQIGWDVYETLVPR